MNRQVHLKFTIRCLSCIGFWPLKFKNNILKMLYAIYFKITLSIYIILVITQFIELIEIANEGFEEICFLLGIILLYLLGLVKVWVIAGNGVRKLIKKVKVTEINILRTNDEIVKKIYMRYVQQNYGMSYLSISVTFICDAMFWVTPVFTEIINPPEDLHDVTNTTVVYKPRPLPIASWFPFDRYKYYKISYTWHIIVLLIIPLYLLSCYVVFLSLLIFVIGQIKILQNNLKEITKHASKNSSGLYDELTVFKNLQKCIEYHKAIIIYVGELSNAMRIFLMLDFGACGLQVAVIGFQAAVADLSFQLFTTIIYLATMLMQLCFFYWFGNEILIESQRISKAIWESEWAFCSKSIKHTLLIMMMRSQKPLTLSVGPFYNVSTATMMMILRTSYSYAAVMRRLYVK